MRRCIVLASLCVLAACAGAEPAPSDSDALRVVTQHMEAFNRHDVAGILGLVAPDVQYFAVAGDQFSLALEGRETLGDRMTTYFETMTTVRTDIEDAVTLGDFVTIRERVTGEGPTGTQARASLGVYEVRDGVIRRVWYFPPQS